MATLAIVAERRLFVVTRRTRGQNQPQKNRQNFSFCRYFPSKCKHLIINHKPTAFPQLARFHFLSWRIFISSVGAFSFPQLARFRFLSWQKRQP